MVPVEEVLSEVELPLMEWATPVAKRAILRNRERVNLCLSQDALHLSGMPFGSGAWS